MRESGRELLEVHVASICFEKGKLLIIKRNSNRKIFPDKRACGGGQVAPGENFEEAVIRQAKEELSADIEVLDVLWTYEINTPDLDQKKIPGVRILGEIIWYTNGSEPTVSDEHSERKKISKEELEDYDFIPGMKEELEAAFEKYDSLKK